MIPQIIHYCWFGKGPKIQRHSIAYKLGKKYYLTIKSLNGMKAIFQLKSQEYMYVKPTDYINMLLFQM